MPGRWVRIALMDFTCCFCQKALDLGDGSTLGLAITPGRLTEEKIPNQHLWCHADCLGHRLGPDVHFDPELFAD
jgi:hypothetical protein